MAGDRHAGGDPCARGCIGNTSINGTPDPKPYSDELHRAWNFRTVGIFALEYEQGPWDGVEGARYSQAELDELAFEHSAPDARLLGEAWHTMLAEAEGIIARLPAESLGTCVLERDGALCRRTPDQVAGAVIQEELIFHHGTLRGALPTVK